MPVVTNSNSNSNDSSSTLGKTVEVKQKKSLGMNKLVLIILLFVLIGVALWFFILKDHESNSVINEEEQKIDKPIEEEKNEERELIDNDSKKKIDAFFNIIDGATDYVKYHFVDNNFLSNSNKMYVSIRSIIDNNKYTSVTNDNLPVKYQNDANYKQYVDNGCIFQATFDDIEEEHKNIFDEKVNFDSLELDSVNSFLCVENEKNFDEELKLMLYNNCACTEQVSDYTVYLSKFKYTYDNDYYYLYLYAGIKRKTENNNEEFHKISSNEIVDVNSFYGNEDKFDIIKWTFKKNFSFVHVDIIN